MAERQTCIMGSIFNRGATDLIGRLRSGNKLLVKREPNNPADVNAVAVMWGSKRIGYVPRGLAKEIAPILDSGVVIDAVKAGPWGVIILTWPDEIAPCDDAEFGMTP